MPRRADARVGLPRGLCSSSRPSAAATRVPPGPRHGARCRAPKRPAPLPGAIDRGHQIYTTGRSPGAGRSRPGSATAPPYRPRALTCVQCHGDDGRGRPEGDVTPPNIAWSGLTRPYGVTRPDGRNHPPYSPALFAGPSHSGSTRPAGRSARRCLDTSSTRTTPPTSWRFFAGLTTARPMPGFRPTLCGSDWLLGRAPRLLVRSPPPSRRLTARAGSSVDGWNSSRMGHPTTCSWSSTSPRLFPGRTADMPRPGAAPVVAFQPDPWGETAGESAHGRSRW